MKVWEGHKRDASSPVPVTKFLVKKSKFCLRRFLVKWVLSSNSKQEGALCPFQGIGITRPVSKPDLPDTEQASYHLAVGRSWCRSVIWTNREGCWQERHLYLDEATMPDDARCKCRQVIVDGSFDCLWPQMNKTTVVRHIEILSRTSRSLVCQTGTIYEAFISKVKSSIYERRNAGNLKNTVCCQ